MGPAAFLNCFIVLALVCCGRCLGGRRRCHAEERRVLLEIKESINYPNGTALADWRGSSQAAGAGAGDDDCCLWSGVTCDDRTGRVVDITLIEARTLEDPWYPNLTSLVWLRELEVLNLAWNKIGGSLPDGICNLTRLWKLQLAGNDLRGPVPRCLCHMISLWHLGLSLNKFNGEIPPCLGNLYYLRKLDLAVNEFRGGIPPSIFANLTELVSVSIEADGLTGDFSFSAFANISSLEEVSLRSNYGLKIETESPSWVPSFQLTNLMIADCVLNKRSDDDAGRFPSGFISTQTGNLEGLILRRASIAGALPLWVLCNSSLSFLDLSDNMLHGTFRLPCRNASSSVETIELSRNRLHGSLPSDVGLSFPNLKILRVTRNELEGKIPLSLGRQPLSVLDLSDNHFTGGIPRTLSTNHTTLQYLNLSYNQLDGEILPRGSYLPNLQVMYLQHNRFTGSIPHHAFNLSLLKALHLGHNDLTCSLSQCLPAFPSMIALSLRENRLEGSLPRHLCLMQQMHLLDLSRNNLSGEIPSCLNNISFWRSRDSQESTAWWSPSGINFIFTNELIQFTSKGLVNSYEEGPLALMSGLDASSNHIDGVIPPEIGELRGLKSLNLSNNHLRGSLPDSIGNMQNLESLDLSRNDLSGAIPGTIAQLNFLSSFSVAFNNLSGVIPSGPQLSTFSGGSYVGNPGLCGAPLEKRCPSPPLILTDGKETEESESLLDSNFLFYLSLAVAFALGFWGFIAATLFCRRLKIKYYGAIDSFYYYRLKRS